MLENQDLSKSVERDVQEIILWHIDSNIVYCADDDFDDAGEEPGVHSKAPKGVDCSCMI